MHVWDERVCLFICLDDIYTDFNVCRQAALSSCVSVCLTCRKLTGGRRKERRIMGVCADGSDGRGFKK